MDRKKIIVTAVLINAGVLTLLFIAAMTLREEAEEKSQSALASEPKPLYQEILESPLPVSVAQPVLPLNEPIAFALPPLEEPKVLPAGPAEIPPAPAAASKPLSAAAPFPSVFEIEVQKGDSLEKIAKTYRTSVDEIIKLNQLPSSFLRAGQKLKIPAEKTVEVAKLKTAPVPQTAEAAEYYTMKVGDNPWSIAMKHHMKVDELLKLNGLNEKTARKLKPGDRLRIR